MLAKSYVAFLFGAAGFLAAQSNHSVIGEGWGLDHVIIGLTSPDAVTDVFNTKLGFAPLLGNKFPARGQQQAIISLPPAYVELLWQYQKPANDSNPNPNPNPYQKIFDSGGGPTSYNVDVFPIEQAVDAIQRLGSTVTLPPSLTTRTPDGKEQPGPWQFLRIDPKDQATHPLGVPGGAAVGFLEYRNNAERLSPERFQTSREQAEQELPDPRRPAGEIHPNTARKLLSVWVAVPNVAEAVQQSARFGFAARGVRLVKAVGEKGHEVQCGQGTIVFFQPLNQKGALAPLVTKRGFGPFGLSVAVGDLKAAQQIVQQGTNTKFPIQQTDDRKSFVVPEELAAGSFIEFVQQ
jgi:hypothetical protein